MPAASPSWPVAVPRNLCFDGLLVQLWPLSQALFFATAMVTTRTYLKPHGGDGSDRTQSEIRRQMRLEV